MPKTMGDVIPENPGGKLPETGDGKIPETSGGISGLGRTSQACLI